MALRPTPLPAHRHGPGQEGDEEPEHPAPGPRPGAEPGVPAGPGVPARHQGRPAGVGKKLTTGFAAKRQLKNLPTSCRTVLIQ